MSLQWGAWAGSGMAAQEGALLSRLARLGMGAIQPIQGLQTLQHCIQGTKLLYIASVDVQSLHPALAALQCCTFFIHREPGH